MMDSKAFFNQFIQKSPEMQERTSTEQYKMSKKFLRYRIEFDMSPQEMACFLNVEKDFYTRLESGDNSLEIYQYNLYLNTLRTQQEFTQKCTETNLQVIKSVVPPLNEIIESSYDEVVHKSFLHSEDIIPEMKNVENKFFNQEFDFTFSSSTAY